MLRMDRVHVIRHKVLVEGASIRSAASALGISRNTVAKYLDESAPQRRASAARHAPSRDLIRERVARAADRVATAHNAQAAHHRLTPSSPAR